MNLPLDNPPINWRVTRNGDAVRIEKIAGTGVGRQQTISVAIAGAFMLSFIVGVQVLSTGRDVLSVLLGWPTLIVLFPIGIMVYLLIHGKRHFNTERVFTLHPGRITVNSRFGQERHTNSLERNRITRFIRSTDEKPDKDGDQGCYLDFLYREGSIDDAELYLGSFWNREEAEWFTRVFERWSGHRVRDEVIPDEDAEDPDDEADLAEPQ
jgi:hypothetical protein